jgi:hypothetical protein
MRKFVAVLAAGLALTSESSSAHHSQAMFDRTTVVHLVGELKAFHYQAPHVWISIIGSPEGKGPDLQWDVETVSPGVLTRIGLTADSIAPGDKLTIGAYPLHDGRRGGMLLYVIKPDGTEVGWRTPETRAEHEKRSAD